MIFTVAIGSFHRTLSMRTRYGLRVGVRFQPVLVRCWHARGGLRPWLRVAFVHRTRFCPRRKTLRPPCFRRSRVARSWRWAAETLRREGWTR